MGGGGTGFKIVTLGRLGVIIVGGEAVVLLVIRVVLRITNWGFLVVLNFLRGGSDSIGSLMVRDGVGVVVG